MKWTLEELEAGEDAAARAAASPIPEDLAPKVRAMVIAVMNKAIELRRLEVLVWRQRVEKASEALADVAPGELGRMDLVCRIERLKAEVMRLNTHAGLASQEVDRLKADLAHLKPSGQVAEDEALLVGALEHINPKAGLLGFESDKVDAAARRLAAGAHAAEALRAKMAKVEKERDAIREKAVAGGERWQGQVDELRARVAELEAAESRLAAIRERGKDNVRLLGLMNLDHNDELTVVGLGRTLRWVLEGDAPQEAKCPHDANGGPCDECAHPQEANRLRAPHVFVPGPDGGSDFCHYSDSERLCGWERSVHRYPCSPTCTHEDAATPGHPERVKERSEEVTATLADARPETLESAAAIEEGAESDAYDRGAEAMRVACWEAIQPKLDALGVDATTREFFKRAIEGAAP
jgi:hypothetical protein